MHATLPTVASSTALVSPCAKVSPRAQSSKRTRNVRVSVSHRPSFLLAACSRKFVVIVRSREDGRFVPAASERLYKFMSPDTVGTWSPLCCCFCNFLRHEPALFARFLLLTSRSPSAWVRWVLACVAWVGLGPMGSHHCCRERRGKARCKAEKVFSINQTPSRCPQSHDRLTPVKNVARGTDQLCSAQRGRG